jgi:hypothetical protein
MIFTSRWTLTAWKPTTVREQALLFREAYQYSQLIYLFDKIAASGKRILAFDICEVCGNQGQWDAIVGSRILYYLSSITGISNKLLFLR